MKQTANHASRQLGGGGCGMRRGPLLHLVSLLLSRPWPTLGGRERRSNFTWWQPLARRRSNEKYKATSPRCYYFPARRERQDTRGLKLKLIDKLARGFMMATKEQREIVSRIIRG